jgi:hypothetical protein
MAVIRFPCRLSIIKIKLVVFVFTRRSAVLHSIFHGISFQRE